MGLQDELAFALRLADVADGISLQRHAARHFKVRLKDDGSPVTEVDVEVEETLLECVQRDCPDDAFLGEEVGDSGAAGIPRRWIVDGIDGTASFATGGNSWATLIALQEAGEIVVGVTTSPALERRWWAARGAGAWSARRTDPPSAPRALRVSETGEGESVEVSVMPPPGSLDGWRDAAVRAVAGRFQSPSTQGHGPLLVAAGRAAASVHLWGGPWDHAAFVVLVEEAGGRFSDLWGGRRIDTGTAVFSNGVAHEQARRVAQKQAPSRPESL
jgi:histidinol-phosphatase